MASASLGQLPDAAYELGQLQKDYRVSVIRLALKAIWAAGLLAVVLAGPVTWIQRGALPPLPKNLSDAVIAIFGLLVLLGLVAWSVWSLVRAFRNRHKRVLIFEQGFVSFRPAEVFVCRWDDILWTKEEVFQVFNAYYPHLTVGLRSGQRWAIDKATDLLSGFSQLEEAIAEQVARHRLPQALTDIHASKTLDFGKLKLSSAGITMGEQTLAWSEVGEFHREDMGVTIVKRGAFLPWAQIHTNELVNQGLLRELVRELGPKS